MHDGQEDVTLVCRLEEQLHSEIREKLLELASPGSRCARLVGAALVQHIEECGMHRVELFPAV